MVHLALAPGVAVGAADSGRALRGDGRKLRRRIGDVPRRRADRCPDVRLAGDHARDPVRLRTQGVLTMTELTPEDLLVENLRMREAIAALSHVVEEVIVLLPARPEIQDRLRQVVSAYTRSGGAPVNHKTPEELLAENARMRQAILVLSDVLDDIIELLPAEPAIQERLRRGNAAARAVLL